MNWLEFSQSHFHDTKIPNININYSGRSASSLSPSMSHAASSILRLRRFQFPASRDIIRYRWSNVNLPIDVAEKIPQNTPDSTWIVDDIQNHSSYIHQYTLIVKHSKTWNLVMDVHLLPYTSIVCWCQKLLGNRIPCSSWQGRKRLCWRDVEMW